MNKVIFIYGPSLTGKTTLAVKIAKYLFGKYDIDSTLVSADSRKVYKNMNVVQSYIFPSVKEKIDVHLVEFCDLSEEFTLDMFLVSAREIIKSAHASGKLPIVFGGNGIYIKALIEGWVTSETLSERTKQTPEFESILFSPVFQKESLLKRMDGWAKHLVKNGLIEEYEKLIKTCARNGFCALRTTLGYKQVDEVKNRFRTIDKVKFVKYLAKELRLFVKKQIKFYANLPDFAEITLDNYKDVIDLLFQSKRTKVP
ncbi:hypothetical protein JW962_03590 [Candidatus Dojkabacteria bacterium]|nr:hypothetical protein [Candidatus Dojkabacteria bacterium]